MTLGQLKHSDSHNDRVSQMVDAEMVGFLVAPFR